MAGYYNKSKKNNYNSNYLIFTCFKYYFGFDNTIYKILGNLCLVEDSSESVWRRTLPVYSTILIRSLTRLKSFLGFSSFKGETKILLSEVGSCYEMDPVYHSIPVLILLSF